MSRLVSGSIHWCGTWDSMKTYNATRVSLEVSQIHHTVSFKIWYCHQIDHGPHIDSMWDHETQFKEIGSRSTPQIFRNVYTCLTEMGTKTTCKTKYPYVQHIYYDSDLKFSLPLLSVCWSEIADLISAVDGGVSRLLLYTP